MSSVLTTELVARLKMDGILRISSIGECLYAQENDVLKLYRPKSKRPIGGRRNDSVLLGDVGFVLRADFNDAGGMSPSTSKPASLSLCPLMNLPNVVGASAVDEGRLRDEFVAVVRACLSALPSTLEEIQRTLGLDFLERTALDRVPIIANFLRGKTAA